MNVFVFVSDKNTSLHKWLTMGVECLKGIEVVSDPQNADIFLVGENIKIDLLYGMGMDQGKQVIAVLRQDPIDPTLFPENFHAIYLPEQDPASLKLDFLEKLHNLVERLNAIPA